MISRTKILIISNSLGSDPEKATFLNRSGHKVVVCQQEFDARQIFEKDLLKGKAGFDLILLDTRFIKWWKWGEFKQMIEKYHQDHLIQIIICGHPDDLSEDFHLLSGYYKILPGFQKEVVLEAISELLSLNIRRSQRVDVQIPVQITLFKRKPLQGKVVNLGVSGCAIRLFQRVAAGEKIHLSFSDQQTAFSIPAVVTRCQSHEGIFVIGVQFVLDHEAQAKVLSLLEELVIRESREKSNNLDLTPIP